MVPPLMARSSVFFCDPSVDSDVEVPDEDSGAGELGRNKKNSPTKTSRRIGTRIKALCTGSSSRFWLLAQAATGYISGCRPSSEPAARTLMYVKLVREKL